MYLWLHYLYGCISIGKAIILALGGGRILHWLHSIFAFKNVKLNARKINIYLLLEKKTQFDEQNIYFCKRCLSLVGILICYFLLEALLFLIINIFAQYGVYSLHLLNIEYIHLLYSKFSIHPINIKDHTRLCVFLLFLHDSVCKFTFQFRSSSPKCGLFLCYIGTLSWKRVNAQSFNF
jgi:hypothetical protein